MFQLAHVMNVKRNKNLSYKAGVNNGRKQLRYRTLQSQIIYDAIKSRLPERSRTGETANFELDGRLSVNSVDEARSISSEYIHYGVQVVFLVNIVPIRYNRSMCRAN